jgi:hypothetical protein
MRFRSDHVGAKVLDCFKKCDDSKTEKFDDATMDGGLLVVWHLPVLHVS